jgi:hypothetical protein
VKNNRRSPLGRSCNGSFIAENAGVTVALFIGLVFPFVDLATVGLRYSLLLRAVHDAAHVGAGATTFSSGSSTYAVMDTAPQQVTKSLVGVSGIDTTGTGLGTTVNIVTTAFTSNIVTVNGNNLPLPQGKIPGSNPPANYPSLDPTANNYAIEVTTKASIQPLIPVNFGFFPTIPGMTGPYKCTVSAQEISEYPSNLTQ